MRVLVLLLSGLALALPPALSGQDPDPLPPAAAPAQEVPAPGPQVQDSTAYSVSPLGAFLRAMVLPSWGHAAIGSYRRGAFYTLAEGGTAWMLLRTAARRSSAREVLAARERWVRAELSQTVTDPEELEVLVAEDPYVDDAQRRVDARQGQFEDWVAMGLFLTFLSGADAFVSAHLRDFPDPIEVGVSPTPGGGVQVGARLKLGAFRR